MMRTTLLASTLALAACGSGATTAPAPEDPAGGGAAATAGTAVELWAAVMKPGAVFTFDDTINGGPFAENPTTVVATVTEVQDVEGGRAAFIAWTENGEPMEVTSIPQVIVVTSSAVTFYDSPEAFASRDPEASAYPAAAEPIKLPDGLYIDPSSLVPGVDTGGELCYGWGPAEGDEEPCEDTCFAQLCVDPELGLTGGEGRWWPSYAAFATRDAAE